jgi:hypothetical protein
MTDQPIPEPVTAAPASGALDAVAVDVLEFERGAIGGVRATDVDAHLAVIGGIAANRASVEKGAVSGIVAREATIRQGLVRGVLARDVRVEQALVRVVVANTVQAGPTTGILVAVARRIDGEAKILVDWRGALAFGAGLGAFLAVIHLATRCRAGSAGSGPS